MKIKLIKLMDKLLGSLVARCLPAPTSRNCMVVRSILIIRPGGIGDAVHLIPAILEFKETVPKVSITVLAETRNDAAFALCPAVERVLRYDRPRELLRALCGKYDVVIDTEQWHRFSAVVARLVNAPISVGFNTNERGRLFSHPVGYSHDTFEAESFRELFRPFAVTRHQNIGSAFLRVPSSDDRRGRDLLGESAATSFVAIFPGASIAERRWGWSNFRKLAVALHERGIPVVVVGGKNDEFEAVHIAAGGVGLQLAGKTTLGVTSAVVARASVLVSGDSGVLHLGVGVGTATVSLFGPGIARKWAPHGENHLVIDKKLPCSPCTRFGTTPPCPYNAKCISSISVEEVLAAVESLVQKGPNTIKSVV